jgi:hypothetical protein
MITKFGSQSREPLEDTDYKLIEIVEHDGDEWAILENVSNSLDGLFKGVREEWIRNDDVASYCIEINGKCYEFARSIT